MRQSKFTETPAYISNNSFLNSGFGEHLRRYLSATMRSRPRIDFASTNIFDAITESCVTCLTRDTAAGHEATCLKGDQSSPLERIREAVEPRA